MSLVRQAACLGILWAVCGCRTIDPTQPDAALPDGGPTDAGEVDAGEPDAGQDLDGGFEADPLLLTQSARAKIADAYETGTIDRKTAALYEVVAFFAPSQLPAGLQSSAPSELPVSAAAALHAYRSRDLYAPPERALWNAVFSRPGSAGFLSFAGARPNAPHCWEHFSSEQGSINGTVLGTEFNTARFTFIPLNTRFATPADIQALDARLTAALQAQVVNDGSEVAGDRPLKDFFDAVFDRYVGLGLPDPRGDVDTPNVPLGGRITVYVNDCAGSTEEAFASPTGDVFVSLRLGLEDPPLRKVVIPHETVHVFEFASGLPSSEHGDWPYEALAVALEDTVARDVKRWSGIPAGGTTLPDFFEGMNRAFRCPEEPFHSIGKGFCKVDKARDAARFPNRVNRAYNGDYSKFVYFLYLAKKSAGTPSIVAWWSRYEAANGDPTSLVPLDELADFQLSLLGEPEGAGEYYYRAEHRARFIAPAARLDFAPARRQRYTFRIEEGMLAAGKYHLAPPVAASAEAPRVVDSRPFPVKPGATHRVLVDIPTWASITPEGIGSLVYDRRGPNSRLLGAFFPPGASGPPQNFTPGDPFQGLNPNTPEDGVYGLTRVNGRYLLLLFVVPPEETGHLNYQMGASFVYRCALECAARYEAQAAACCPGFCIGSDPPCISDCEAGAGLAAQGGACGAYCLALNSSYPSELATTSQATMSSRITMAAGAPPDAWTGVVGFPEWLPALTCSELELPPP